MIGQTPAIVGDLTNWAGFLLSIAGVVALMWRIAKPGLHRGIGQVVRDATEPRFTALESSITATRNDLTTELREHMVREESEGSKWRAEVRASDERRELRAGEFLTALDRIGVRVEEIEDQVAAHLEHHPGPGTRAR